MLEKSFRTLNAGKRLSGKGELGGGMEGPKRRANPGQSVEVCSLYESRDKVDCQGQYTCVEPEGKYGMEQNESPHRTICNLNIRDLCSHAYNKCCINKIEISRLLCIGEFESSVNLADGFLHLTTVVVVCIVYSEQGMSETPGTNDSQPGQEEE